MRRWRWSRTASGPLALLAAGCGGNEPAPVVRPLPPPVTTVEPAAPPFVSPARWSFHPPNPSSATASVILPDGSCLFTTDDGLRIKATKGERSTTGLITCRGRITAASDVASEGLVGIVEQPGSSWLFIGQLGNLYESERHLDGFRRIIGAPTTFSKVVGSGKTILAAAPNGELFRLDESSSWQSLKLANARVHDLVIAEDGSALALALPEKLFTSVDGRSFLDASAVGTIGARQLGRTASGQLAVRGVLGSIVWDPKNPAGPAQTNEAVSLRSAVLELDAATVPSATAVVEGRAALDGDRFVEAVVVDEDNGIWGLATGTFEGPLTTTRLAQKGECASMRVGARGRHVTTLCVKTDDDGNHTTAVRMSSDGGNKFGDEALFTKGDDDLLGVAVAIDGSALVTGLCKARTGSSGCSGSPPMLVRVENGAVTSTLAATPPLMGLPISPAFSVDGKSAYFLARRAKDERLALFVSHDGGRTFTERALDGRSGPDTKDPEEMGEGESAEESFDPSDLTTLRPSDDGTLGMVLTTSRGLSYLTTDEDGRVLGMSHPPVEHAILGGYGRHVLALATTVDRTLSKDTFLPAWESNDGGSSWNEISVVHAVTHEIISGPSTVACASAGCLVGGTITRVGWEGQTDAPSIARPKAVEMRKVPALRTPIVCTLDPKTPWKQVDHVWTGPPTLAAVARGRALWSMLSFDPATSAITTTAALWPDRGDGPARVVTRPMFNPAPAGTEYAVDVSMQVEGYAAARIRLPAGDRPTGPMRNVEVGWENFFDGTSRQTTIPDAGTFLDGDVKRDDGRRYLDTGLMSVTSSAIFVRPHAKETKDERMFLIDTKGNRAAPSFPNWRSLLQIGQTNFRDDTALAEGKPIAVGTVSDIENDSAGTLTMVLAPPVENGLSKATATSLFPPTSADHQRVLDHDWTYRGPTEVGVVGVMSEPQMHRATALFLPFRADGRFGRVVELPTPYDLPDIPRPCKADERRTTVRAAASGSNGRDFMFPGYRHPVFVSEAQKDKPTAGDVMTLLTWGTVLYGTKENPCVAGWEAFGIGTSGLVAVIGGDLSQAWIFRQVQDVQPPPGLRLDRFTNRREKILLEHRSMSCRFDSSALISDTLYQQSGAFRWIAK
ncbi:MAG TPA: hypothetical protein PK156_06900 [Polyangium sp.]|nr:hypothetical protein [Polyangium sp.]